MRLSKLIVMGLLINCVIAVSSYAATLPLTVGSVSNTDLKVEAIDDGVRITYGNKSGTFEYNDPKTDYIFSIVKTFITLSFSWDFQLESGRDDNQYVTLYLVYTDETITNFYLVYKD